MDEYLEGSWNVLCQRCGRKYKAHQVTKEWTGSIVCKGQGTNECFEFRHPQDFLRAHPEDQSVPFTSPEPADVFVDVPYIDESVGTQDRTPKVGTFNNEI